MQLRMQPLGWGCYEEPHVGCRPEPAHFRHYGHSQLAQDITLHRRIFCDMCEKVPRTYIELGALDGTTLSNTLLLERVFGWRGLLIEGQPTKAQKLNESRGQSGRNFIVPEAVCKEPGFVKFITGDTGSGLGGVAESLSERYKKSWSARLRPQITVPCRPISQMIKQAGLREVDLFVLDVEGGELDVLRTMDWDVRVHLWMIEQPAFVPGEENKPAEIRRLLASKGYVEVTKSLGAGPRLGETNWSRTLDDMLFVHEELQPTFHQRMDTCLNLTICGLKEYMHTKRSRPTPG